MINHIKQVNCWRHEGSMHVLHSVFTCLSGYGSPQSTRETSHGSAKRI